MLKLHRTLSEESSRSCSLLERHHPALQNLAKACSSVEPVACRMPHSSANRQSQSWQHWPQQCIAMAWKRAVAASCDKPIPRRHAPLLFRRMAKSSRCRHCGRCRVCNTVMLPGCTESKSARNARCREYASLIKSCPTRDSIRPWILFRTALAERESRNARMAADWAWEQRHGANVSPKRRGRMKNRNSSNCQLDTASDFQWKFRSGRLFGGHCL